MLLDCAAFPAYAKLWYNSERGCLLARSALANGTRPTLSQCGEDLWSATALGTRAGISYARLHHFRAAGFASFCEGGLRSSPSCGEAAHAQRLLEAERRGIIADRLQPTKNALHALARRIARAAPLRSALPSRSAGRLRAQNARSLQGNRPLDR